MGSTPLKKTYRIHIRDITGAITRGKRVVLNQSELTTEEHKLGTITNPEKFATTSIPIEDGRYQLFVTRHIVSAWFETVTDEA